MSQLDSTASSTTESTQAVQENGKEEDVVFRARPTIKPTVILLTLIILSTGLIAGGIIGARLFGSDRELWAAVVGIVGLATTLRLIVKMLVLRQTEYVITGKALYSEYTLFYRYYSRELPLRQVRSFETVRSRIQGLLGYGTIRFCGVNGTFGTVSFENLDNPTQVQNQIRDILSEESVAS